MADRNTRPTPFATRLFQLLVTVLCPTGSCVAGGIFASPVIPYELGCSIDGCTGGLCVCWIATLVATRSGAEAARLINAYVDSFHLTPAEEDQLLLDVSEVFARSNAIPLPEEEEEEEEEEDEDEEEQDAREDKFIRILEGKLKKEAKEMGLTEEEAAIREEEVAQQLRGVLKQERDRQRLEEEYVPTTTSFNPAHSSKLTAPKQLIMDGKGKRCRKCGLNKLRGGAVPDRKAYFDIVKQSYEPSAARQIGGWALVAESPTIKIYQMDGDAVVSIRGTFDSRDTQADSLIALNRLESSSRFQEDLKFLDSFQKKNSGLQYFGVGHSLGGAILDLFLTKGMIKQGQSYNPAIQPRDLSKTLPNNRIFMSGDPLYTLARPLLKQKPEVIQEKTSMLRKLARLTPLGNVLTSGDYLKSHGLAQFEGKGQTHKQNVLKKLRLKDEGHSIRELAKISGVPVQILLEVYNRGIGAYKTNPESVRIKGTFKKGPAPMSQKLSKEQWAMARVYSFLDGNPKHDQDLKEV